MRRDNWVLFGAVIGSLAIIIVIGLGLTFLPNLLVPVQPTPTTGGILVEKPRQMGDFTLTDQNGKPVKLSDLHGKAVLMFFGYTHCPDVCPLTMADFKKVKQSLQQTAPSLGNRVTYVMISVDGQRDTPPVMKKYVDLFDSAFIGLTGSPDQVANIGVDYGVKAELLKSDNSQDNYTVAHTSFTYLLDPKGYWRVAYPFQTPTNLIVSDVTRILSE
jgi:protein SCO1/2